MEEENVKDMPLEEPLPPPPPPEEPGGIKVKVIKPFKPTPMVTRVVRQGKCYFHPTKPASYICSSCGKNICTFCASNVGGVFFCPQCAPLERPREVTSAPLPPDYTSWYHAMLSIGVIILITGVILTLIYWPLTTMNAAEFENLEDDYNNSGMHNIEGYAPGDVVVVRDTIARKDIVWDPTYGVITRLWFESTGEGDTDFFMDFDADLEQDYNVGDTVYITLHVDEDSRTQNEIFRELYNNRPDISNIDHTVSVDIVFFAMIGIGAFLILLSVLFMQKAKRPETTESLEPKDESIEQARTEAENWPK